MKSRLCVAAGAVILVFGCASTPPFLQPVEPGIEREVRAILEGLFPSSGVMVHKVSVRVARRDLVLTGYLLLDRASGFEAVAVDEFGGKVFAFSNCDGRTKVDFAPPNVDRDVLARGPAADLDTIFLLPRSEIRVGSMPDDTVFASWLNGEERVDCEVDLGARRVRRCRTTRGRQSVRDASFVYGSGPLAEGDVPTSIEVLNRRLHYTMKVQMLEFRPSPDSAPAPCG